MPSALGLMSEARFRKPAAMLLGLMNITVALNLRFPEESAFGPSTVSNPKLLWAFAWAIVGSMLITQIRVLQDLFGTVPLTGEQWLVCLVPAVVLLILGELFKLILRARRPKITATVPASPVPA